MRDIKNTNLKKQIAIGEKLFLSGRVDEAKHHFEKLLDKYPSLASINNNLGVIYFHEGKPKKALLAFKAALKNDPYYIDALINVISLLGKNGLRDKELLSILLSGLEKNILPRQAIFPITLRWEWVEFLTSELISRSSWREATRLIIEYRIRTPDNISRDFFIKYLSNKPLRLCLVMDQGIGNMVMLTPTIRAIKKLLPKSLLDVVGKKGSLQVIEGWDLVHESFDYLDFKPSNKYDILLLTIWSNEFIKKHEKKINALDIPIIKKSFTNPDRHESQYHLDLARFIGYQGELPEPYCRTDRVTVPFKNSEPVALLSDTTFNSPEWQRKRWPYYRELAKALIEKGYQVGLIGGLDEANNFRQDDWPKGIINLMGKYSIPQTAYLISKADIFIGNDSGPSHIAGAVGTKAFIIFGATRETKNRPLGKSVDVITLNIPCRPCQYTQKWATCTNWQCVTNLSVGCILEHIDRNEAIGRISGLHHSSHSYCIDGLSVVIPTHNRSLLLISNIQKGRILGMTKKIIIDDNSDPQQKEILRALDNKQDITVVYSKRNEGVAKALKKSTPFVRTEYVTFGGDDDEIYVLNKKRFLREMSLLNNEYVLLTSKYVMNFNPEKETYSIGYCKADFENIQAGELLKFMFCTGETAGTCIGNVYKTEQIMPTLPESVFRVSEDKVFMARLLGKNVDKKIHISDSLVYIRRVSGDTLSRNYDSVKIFIDFLALLVCGYYCLENDLIDAEGIISHLRMRATLLEKIYGHALAILDHIVEYLFDQITLDELFNDLNLDHLSSLSLPSEIISLRNLLLTTQPKPPFEVRCLA